MKNLQLLVVGLVAFMFTACSDDETGDPNANKLPSRVSFFFEGGNSEEYLNVTTIAYDFKNRVSEINNIGSYGINGKSVISYTESGEVKSITKTSEQRLLSTSEFTYNENTIIHEEFMGEGHDPNYFLTTLTFNNNKQLIELKGHYSHKKYLYDSNGNLSAIEHYDDEKLIIKQEFVYDNKNGILIRTNTPAWLITLLNLNVISNCTNNNLIEQKTSYYFENAPDPEKLTISYEYDEDTFPSAYTMTNPDNTTSTAKFIYKPANL